MANYAKMTSYELEQLLDKYNDELCECENEERADELQVEIDFIEAELDGRDPLDEED